MKNPTGIFRESVGARIRQLRKAAGLTQEQLAKRADMDYKYLGSIERGERNVTLDNVERLVRALDVEPYEPFLFPKKGTRNSESPDQSVLPNLLRHIDPQTQAIAVEIVQSLLRWVHSRKR